jgi:hypothetical protein
LLTGEYADDEYEGCDEQTIRITHSYSKAYRPDLKHHKKASLLTILLHREYPSNYYFHTNGYQKRYSR